MKTFNDYLESIYSDKILEQIQNADPYKLANMIKKHYKESKWYYNWRKAEIKEIWGEVWQMITELYLKTDVLTDLTDEEENAMEKLVIQVIKALTGRNNL